MATERTTSMKSQTIPSGYMTIEESRRLCHESIAEIEKLLQQQNAAYHQQPSIL